MSDERISDGTFFLKRVFPLLGFCELSFFVGMAFFSIGSRVEDMAGDALMGVVMTVIFIGVVKNLILDLVDEVQLCGDRQASRRDDPRQGLDQRSAARVGGLSGHGGAGHALRWVS